jgi:hypothetical protein
MTEEQVAKVFEVATEDLRQKRKATNEDWFCSLSTEEKAKWIATQCGNAVMESTYDVSKLRKKMYWLDWLKEKHNGV